ncbi:hypothetical protein J6590_068441 [Homalodisca vitripennis]|nr:hypothetical protein J6590_068441 [Homalodisca vitripennis]
MVLPCLSGEARPPGKFRLGRSSRSPDCFLPLYPQSEKVTPYLGRGVSLALHSLRDQGLRSDANIKLGLPQGLNIGGFFTKERRTRSIHPFPAGDHDIGASSATAGRTWTLLDMESSVLINSYGFQRIDCG